MNFPRGFKAHANRLALEVRDDLDLNSISPLCPWALAQNLSIPVIPLRELSEGRPSVAEDVDHLAYRDPDVFSAITVFRGPRRLIVHNDAHAPTRQRSNLAHELAHALLMHPPHPPFCSKGQRIFNSKLEAEANWLGPVLLVTNEAARWVVSRRMNEREAAQHFSVSVDLMRFRLRMSGANRIAGYR
jgi:hypothetical protein